MKADSRARRARAVAERMCARCFSRPAREGFTECGEGRCAVFYRPVDQTLKRTTIRVLRALRHWDWAEAVDVRNTLGGDESPAIGSALVKLHMSGHIERKLVVGGYDRSGRALQIRMYRITQAGRDHLAAALAQGMGRTSQELALARAQNDETTAPRQDGGGEPNARTAQSDAISEGSDDPGR